MSEETAAPTLVEGRNHDLKCLVKNVAPMRNLQVSWHLGNKVLKTETFEDDSTKSPSNISSSITLTANRGDAGAEIWCEAKLMFGATAPPLPATRSKRVQLQVLCKFSLCLKPIYLFAFNLCSSPSSLCTSRSAHLCQS